ncbi:MAG: hypothetical protein KJ011_01755 [Burkholderiaceae bacterium]|nr:hypothetical protein [Burkholderiaceae bacterium]
MDFSREDRVRLIAEAAEALLDGRLPRPAARLFVGGALQAWLREGGRCGALERDFLKVTQRQRSRLSPQRLYARCARTATDDAAADTVEASTTNGIGE